MTTALIGLGTAVFGFAGGLLLPWVRWFVEKRRERLSYRRSQVAVWREALAQQEFELTDSRSDFLGSAAYSSLRVQLSDKTRAEVENSRVFHSEGSRGPHRKNMLLDEVARIEKEWGLV